MSLPRIEVCDPSEEGDAIRAGLRASELFVVRRDVEDFYRASEAVVIVLAGDAEGALDALAHMRGKSSVTRTPVILVGHPDEAFGEPQALLLGAHAFFKRPVDVAVLAARIVNLISAEREAPVPTTGNRPVTTFVGTITGRERTLQLIASEPAPAYAGAAARELTLGGSIPPPPVPKGPVADLSPRLRSLFEEADRRVFPNGPPLEISFPASDESPDELVPADLLDHVVNVLDMPEDDVLESLTFVGPPPVRTEGHSKSSANRSRSQPPTDAESQAQDFGSQVARSNHDANATGDRAARRSVLDLRRVISPRRASGDASNESDSAILREAQTGTLPNEGSLLEGGLLPIMLRLVDERSNGVLAVRAEGMHELRFLFESGTLRAMSGGIAIEVVAALNQERAWSDANDSESEANAALKRRVEAKLLSSFELEKRLSVARHALLANALFAREGSFTWGPIGPRDADLAAQTRRPFLTQLHVVLLEASRRRMTNERLLNLLGRGSIKLVREKQKARAVFAHLPSEIDAWLTTHHESTLDALLAEAPPEEGIAGVLYMLSLVGGITVDREVVVDLSTDEAKTRIDELMKRMKELAEEGDYFTVLGIVRGASAREVRDAYEERARMLRALPLSDLGLAHHEAARERILDVLRDGYEVLVDDNVRVDYANALFGDEASRELSAFLRSE